MLLDAITQRNERQLCTLLVCSMCYCGAAGKFGVREVSKSLSKNPVGIHMCMLCM